MELDERMELFRELALCGDSIYTWCYDADGTLLQSNCPDEHVLGTAFVQFHGKTRMLEHAETEQRRLPRLIGTAIGMIWYAAYEYAGEALKRCWTLGPVFYKDIPMNLVIQGSSDFFNQVEVSQSWKYHFYQAVKQIPVASHVLMQRYALMLHYCLTGQHLEVSDICMGAPMPETMRSRVQEHDRHKVYMRERALLDMVRNGDLNYAQALNDSQKISSGVPVSGTDILRQAKTSVTVFASLVCRAAMEGGLSPEVAYSLSDSYIQAAENARSYEEISVIAPTLYRDFIERVHKLRENPHVSVQIRRCCDYIEMNVEKKLRAKDLAQLVGYSEYYLTQRFHEEMGVSFQDYVRAAKIERAKTLLASTNDSTAEIAARLSFGTRSYFSQVFTEVVGLSPAEYRQSLRS